MDDRVALGREDAQRIFDMAVGADQACSGFMENDDVEAMRRLALAIGVDPLIGTPEGFIRQYPHPFQPMTNPMDIDRVFRIRRVVAVHGPNGWDTERNDEVPPYVPCRAGRPWCTKAEDDPIHQAAERGA